MSFFGFCLVSLLLSIYGSVTIKEVMDKSDFTVGSLWIRKVDGVDPFYFLVIKTRPLDVQFAGFKFELKEAVGTYYFNWTEILNRDNFTNNYRITWEKVS